MKRIIIPFALGFLILYACQKTEIAGFHDKPIVESYLKANTHPIVTVSKLIPFTSDMQFSSEDVNKLNISITETGSGTQYALTKSGEGEYTNMNLIIQPGKSYELSFPYNGLVINAKTAIPDKPQNFYISTDTITVYPRTEGFGGGPSSPAPVKVYWTNSDQSYYLVAIKNIETIKTEINPNEINGFNPPKNQPVTTAYAEISTRAFQYYGWHKVYLYKIRPEYVLFFQGTSNSSTSLTEVNSNIVNGYGVFTGMNCDSTMLLVAKPQ